MCQECQSVDELPPHKGRPEDDVTLERLIYDLHTNSITGPHHGLLFTVPVSAWVNENARREIIRQIRQGGSAGIDELDPGYYNSRNQMRADAGECYSKHFRPKGSCVDYMTESKRILPPTAALRKEVGLPKPSESGVSVHLCSSCVVHSWVITKKRTELGMYK